jgi:hypothetical protein
MAWELLALIEEPALPMDAADCFTIAYNDEGINFAPRQQVT